MAAPGALYLRLWPESYWAQEGHTVGQGQSSDSGWGLFMKPSRAPGLNIFLCLPYPHSIPVSQSPPLSSIHLCLPALQSLCPPIYVPISPCLSSLHLSVSPISYVPISLPLHLSYPHICLFMSLSPFISLFPHTSLFPRECLAGCHICFPVSPYCSLPTSLSVS